MLVAILFGSCRKPGGIPDTPTLKYEDYEYNTYEDPNFRNILLELYFTDGDGNIGYQGELPDPGGCDTSSYNLFIRYFEKVEGSFTEVEAADSCQPYHNILPDLTPAGQNKTLEGNIYANFSYAAFPVNNGVDSIMFEFKLKDRDGNESPWVASDPIPTPD